MPFTSRQILFVLYLFLLGVHFFYYPKWKKNGTEATISWDVSGYYMYLPATFIYQDIKKCGFKDEVLKKYGPTPDFQQAFIHKESGNYVMKYSIGQSLQFAPFFFIGHAWASISDTYPADGFSFPYQFMISMGMLLYTLIGLIFLRKILLEYFNDKTVAWTLIGIVLGSNYLNYTAIDGAMTHNTLFTIYTLLIFTTIQFYKNPTMLKAIGVGGLVGMAALIRPTEILSCLIPILWGVNLLDKKSRTDRLGLIQNHLPKLLLAVITCIAIGSIQLMYWKYASGDWIVYSYEDQGFSWLKPHLHNGLLSYRSGWLTYSPFMIFSLIGFIWLFKKDRGIFWPTFIFSILFIYIAFAWDIWWYGGSLGQRTMVQAYPVLAFPIAAFFEKYLDWNKVLKVILGVLIGIMFYLNLWFTHQAHIGGMVKVGQMTKAYYWKVLGTFDKKLEHQKLLDTKEIFEGTPKDLKEIYFNKDQVFELNKEKQSTPGVMLPMEEGYDWLRVSADFSIQQKEWNFWRMTQFVVKFKNKDKVVQQRMMRIQRMLNDNQTKRIHFDLPFPDKLCTDIDVNFWNAEGHKSVKISNVKVELFRE